MTNRGAIARCGQRLGLALCLLLGLVRAADAHAVLVASNPADHAVLERAPSRVSLVFDENVALTQLTLVGVDGAAIPMHPAVTDTTVTGELPGLLGAGIYTLSYRVVSADGHVVGGALQFSIGAAPGAWNAAADSEIATERWLLAGLGWLTILAGFLCFGLPLPWRAGASSRRRHGDALAVVSATAALVAIAVQGATMRGGFIASGLVDPASWRVGIATPTGQYAGLWIAGLVLQRVAARGHGARILYSIAAALVVSALATTGHVHTLGWLPSVVLAIHVAGALFWVSTLLPLLRRLHQPAPGAALKRFSVFALPIVVVLILAGAALACLQMLRPIEFVVSAYGNVLAAKLALVVVLLVLGTINRWSLLPRIERGSIQALSWVRRSVQAELVLLALILALTAALGELTPPRHLLAAAPRHTVADQMIMDREAMAMATMFANPGGDYDFQVWFSDDAHNPVAVQKVTIELANPEAGVGPIQRDLQRGPDGMFKIGALALSPRGNWRVTIKADLSDFDRRIFVLPVKN